MNIVSILILTYTCWCDSWPLSIWLTITGRSTLDQVTLITGISNFWGEGVHVTLFRTIFDIPWMTTTFSWTTMKGIKREQKWKNFFPFGIFLSSSYRIILVISMNSFSFVILLMNFPLLKLSWNYHEAYSHSNFFFVDQKNQHNNNDNLSHCHHFILIFCHYHLHFSLSFIFIIIIPSSFSIYLRIFILFFSSVTFFSSFFLFFFFFFFFFTYSFHVFWLFLLKSDLMVMMMKRGRDEKNKIFQYHHDNHEELKIFLLLSNVPILMKKQNKKMRNKVEVGGKQDGERRWTKKSEQGWIARREFFYILFSSLNSCDSLYGHDDER